MTATVTHVSSGVHYAESYLQAVATLERHGCLHQFRHGDAVVPLIIRPLPKDCAAGFDAITPYDFSGPLLGSESPHDVWDALRAWAAEKGIVTAFLRFHPLLADGRDWRGLPGLEIIEAGDHVVIDLADRSTMLDSFKRTVRRDLKVAHRAGVRCDLEPINANNIETFATLYDATMARHDADDFYRFPRSFFYRLVESLGDSFMMATATMSGRTVATSLTMLDGFRAHYYLSALDYEHRAACSTNMLVVETASRLHELGVQRYHLGGGATTLRAFKERFGPGRAPFFLGRAIFDTDRYAAMTLGLTTEFFPAYRAK